MKVCNILTDHCANCPIRRAGREKPRSIFARIHRWHSSWWPGWKGYLTTRHSDAKRKLAET